MCPRPRKSEATRETQQVLFEAAVYGAKLIRDVLKGTTRKTPKSTLTKTPRVAASKLFAAKIAIEHAIGLPKAKLELKTNALTMKEIAEIASDFNTEPTVEHIPKPVKSAKN